MWQDARSALLSDDDAPEMSAVLASLLLVLGRASTSDGQMLGPAAPGASRQQHDGPLRHPRPHDWMTKYCLLPRLGALLYQVRCFWGCLMGRQQWWCEGGRRGGKRVTVLFFLSLKPSWTESLFNTTMHKHHHAVFQSAHGRSSHSLGGPQLEQSGVFHRTLEGTPHTPDCSEWRLSVKNAFSRPFSLLCKVGATESAELMVRGRI